MKKLSYKLFLLSFFTNRDEPLPPSNKWPKYPMWLRKILWWVRNPAHDFTFHIVGIAGKDFTSYGAYPEHVWNPNDGWNWAVREYGWLRLPFVSYRGEYIESYIGWRNVGNLGLSLRKARG